MQQSEEAWWWSTHMAVGLQEDPTSLYFDNFLFVFILCAINNCRTKFTNYLNKKFVHNEQIICTVRTNMYACDKFYKLPEQKIVRNEQTIWTNETNMYTCRTNFTNSRNKIFVRFLTIKASQ
jgi:hypothetical protein